MHVPYAVYVPPSPSLVSCQPPLPVRSSAVGRFVVGGGGRLEWFVHTESVKGAAVDFCHLVRARIGAGFARERGRDRVRRHSMHAQISAEQG